MTKLIVEYNSNGKIVDWRHEVDNDYRPEDNELEADSTRVDFRRQTADAYRVDLSADPPELVPNPTFEPIPDLETLNERVKEIQNNPQGTPFVVEPTPDQQQAFEDAREAGDVQAQLDALFDIVTDGSPGNSP